MSGTVWARIDRPAGVISFRNKRDAEDVMNDWSSDMAKLLGLVEKTWMRSVHSHNSIDLGSSGFSVNAAQAAQTRVKA